jgi:hypothetical protein
MPFDDGSNNFTSTAGNSAEKRLVDARKSKGYVHYIATLGGASNIAVHLHARLKESV